MSTWTPPRRSINSRFAGRAGERRHAVPHLVKELDRQMTETSRPQHRHLGRFRQVRPQDPREDSQPGREQRRRRRRVELRREPEGEPTIDEDVIGETTIPVDGDDLLAGAQLLRALLAVGALEASLLLVADAHAIAPPQVGHLGTDLFDDADDLMARDQGERASPQSSLMNWMSPLATLQCVIATRTSRLPRSSRRRRAPFGRLSP